MYFSYTTPACQQFFLSRFSIIIWSLPIRTMLIILCLYCLQRYAILLFQSRDNMRDQGNEEEWFWMGFWICCILGNASMLSFYFSTNLVYKVWFSSTVSLHDLYFIPKVTMQLKMAYLLKKYFKTWEKTIYVESSMHTIIFLLFQITCKGAISSDVMESMKT